MLAVTEHDDLSKTRKSIFGASIYTFVVANAHFLTDKMSIFGLEVAVVQSDLVLLGRISSGLLLFFFVLHGTTNLLAILELWLGPLTKKGKLR